MYSHQNTWVVSEQVVAPVVLPHRIGPVTTGGSLCGVVGLEVEVRLGARVRGHVRHVGHQEVLIVRPKLVTVDGENFSEIDLPDDAPELPGVGVDGGVDPRVVCGLDSVAPLGRVTQLEGQALHLV